jgi:hypothetical protein
MQLEYVICIILIRLKAGLCESNDLEGSRKLMHVYQNEAIVYFRILCKEVISET